jgi:protein TonB
MTPKKTPKADLVNKRGLFFQIGLCVSLLATILFFMWSRPVRPVGIIESNVVPLVVEMPPVVRPPEPERKPSAPKVAQLVELINIVDNHVKIKEIVDPFNVELPVFYGPEGFDGSGTEAPIDEGPIDFVIIEDKPLFQGQNIDAFRTWVNQHLVYPALAAENGVEGRVTVQFVIDRNGNLVDIEVLASPDRSLAEEAVRVIGSSPQWTPGKQRGRPVPVRFVIPVEFVLQ